MLSQITTCSIDECAKPPKTRGWCNAHYTRWRRHGHPLAGGPDQPHPPRSTSVEERFWAKVDKSGECWLWLAGTKGNGYGRFKVDGQRVLAHRFAYELLVGPVPEGLTLDHLCRVRACVNSAHLEPVTNKENILRGESTSAINARKTHCKWGHEFTPENTYWRPDGSGRDCRACRHRLTAESRARAKAA